MQFVGPPFTFSFQQLGEASGTISKNAAAMIEGGTFWMGTNNFYAYDGAVSTLNCPVLNRVFSPHKLSSSMKYGGSMLQQAQQKLINTLYTTI
jgi:hypothetical protein